MTDSFLDNAGGWTPAPDVLARKYGFESAYLWGRLRRLCQLGGGTYTISPEALGKRFGMSRRTVIDRLKAMLQDGYVEDLTPGVRNKAHTYSVKKGEAKILAGVQISHTDIETIPQDDELGTDMGMRILHSDDAEIAHPNDAGMQDLPNRYAKNAHPGMQNLHLNRDSLETIKESTSKEVGDKSPPPIQEIEPNLEQGIPEVENPPPILKKSRAVTIPAIQVFVDITGKFVLNNTQIKEIDNKVGRDPPALDKWREVVKAWQLHGNKINNVSGMLDWFKKGIPVYAQKASQNGHHSTSQNQPRSNAGDETSGLSETSKAIAAAWESKRRRSRDPT